MFPDVNPDDLEKGKAAFRSAMVSNALRHLREFDARTAVVLHKNGFLTRDLPENYPNEIETILPEQDHQNRIPLDLGPLLFYRENDSTSRVFKVVEALLIPKGMLRASALAHFERMTSLTPRTKETMRKYKEDLVGDNSGRWHDAAVTISDSVENDFLCNLVGFKQSIEMQFQQGCNEYSQRILRPTFSSVNSIELKIQNPSRQRAEISAIIESLVADSESLSDALDFYFRCCGHLPLAPDLSASQLVQRWLHVHGRNPDTWEILRGWANGTSSPVPRYHVCQALVNDPELVPETKTQQFWNEVAEVLAVPHPDLPETKWTQAWQIRCDLAKHYCRHFESSLKETDGETLVAFCWWLSEQVSQIFENRAKQIQVIREGPISSESEVSTVIWKSAHAFARPSPLRFATLFTNSIWSTALQCQLRNGIEQLEPGTMKSTDRQHIRRAFNTSLVAAFPLRSKAAEATYAFEDTLLPAAEAWMEIEENEKPREFLHALVQANSILQNDEKLQEQLPRMNIGNEGDQILTANALRIIAYDTDPPAETLWECLSDQQWREDVLLRAHSVCLDILFDALSEIQMQHGEKWILSIPHFFAEACEKSSENRERQTELFVMTLLNCISTGTVSAVERIVQPKNRKELGNDIEEWAEQLNNLRLMSPDWIAGRIRATLASLNAY